MASKVATTQRFMHEPEQTGGPVKTFVLRKGRITAGQQRALQTFSGIPFTHEPLDYRALFANDNPVYCEIGFGMGDATVILAEQNPDKNYLGIEVFEAGVGKLWAETQKRSLTNLKIIKHDAVAVITAMILPASIAGFHLFFPDPWPKKRHHKRRLVRRPFTDLLAEKLSPSGYIYFATDWEPYAEWALHELGHTPRLANKYAGFAPRQEWRPVTKFEKKAAASGRETKELFFVKEGLPNKRI
jgi:tRNA (guanine-N7-)-methyltransferase